MSESLRVIARRINQLYLPRDRNTNWSFDAFINYRPVRYFSYGRHALFEALQTVGCTNGDKIMLPAFICRDLLSAINTTGAIPVYYDVDRNLQLAEPPELLSPSKAVLAVNYFGFPQNLAPFRRYCKKTGAVMIEDNAHGFLSRDEKGQALGTRGEIGIFSIRKTLLLPDGAAMVINTPDRWYPLNPQKTPSGEAGSLPFTMKRILRRLQPFIDLRTIRLFISITKAAQKIVKGHEILPSAPNAEFRLPENAGPCEALLSSLARLDENHEVYRRRKLYLILDSIIRHIGYEPVFPSLPANVVPYAYPFHSSENKIDFAKKTLKKLGLECFPWPELPDKLGRSFKYYKKVWMVSLW